MADIQLLMRKREIVKGIKRNLEKDREIVSRINGNQGISLQMIEEAAIDIATTRGG
jgi:hypothetical protein